jgi:hypothetical protein
MVAKRRPCRYLRSRAINPLGTGGGIAKCGCLPCREARA